MRQIGIIGALLDKNIGPALSLYRSAHAAFLRKRAGSVDRDERGFSTLAGYRRWSAKIIVAAAHRPGSTFGRLEWQNRDIVTFHPRMAGLIVQN